MPSCHEAGRHPAFPLSDSTITEEVVAVHHSQLVQEELYGALAPPFLGTLPLQRTQHQKRTCLNCGDMRKQEKMLTVPVPVSA